MRTISRHSSAASKLLLDLLLPPRCPMTGNLVGSQGALDPQYWAQLNFIQAPFCACCGNPFPHGTPGGMLCSPCLRQPPPWHSARAALRYNDASSGMILKFKHADGTILAPLFAKFMGQAGADMLETADYLVPVPLHRWRLWRRRYNQAGLLCAALSKLSGVAHLRHTLRRGRATVSQGHKSGAERAANVKNAFFIPPAQQPLLKGKHVILVDDVLTSGATVDECAKILLATGAARVDVLVLAKVVRGE